MKSRTMVMINLFSGKQWRNIENRPKDIVGGEEGEGEMYEESNMEICNTICKIDSQCVFAVCSGNSNRVL